MNCQLATNLISSLIDGEISSSDQAALDDHLATCPACRATLDALRAQDSDLSKAFAPRRAAAAAVADRAIAQIHREHIQSARPRRFPFLNTLLSAAAGFVLALLIIRPCPKPNNHVNGCARPVTQPTDNALGHLPLATDTIEILPPIDIHRQHMPTSPPAP